MRVRGNLDKSGGSSLEGREAEPGVDRAGEPTEKASSPRKITPRRAALIAAPLLGALILFVASVVLANTNPQALPFSQDWSDTNLITTNDDWSGVPGIVGYSPNVAGTSSGVDPQSITEDRSGTIDVIANQTNPSATLSPPAGVGEFHITNPVVALRGDSDNDSPNIVINLDTTDRENINVRYNLRDIDGSIRDAVQQVALQYRVGNSGTYTNVPAGYVADATTGPSLATQVTPVNATLPSDANDKPQVQVRIITADANDLLNNDVVDDEWVGVDDINVTGAVINNAPVANDDMAATDEDEPVDVDVLANDTDPDGDTLELESFTQPDNGEVTRNPDDTLRYAPDQNFSGTDTFTYTVSDGSGGTDTATVTITVTGVNDAPVAVNDAYSTDEDEELTVAAPGVLSNDTDIEGDALEAVLVEGPSNGTLTLNSDGSFTYDPDEDFEGADSFTYKANDGTNESNTATVTITVTPVNDASVAVNDTYTTNEDEELTVPAPGVLGNDTDAEGDALTAELVDDVSNGTLTLNSDGSFTYMPNDDFEGADSFTYQACDSPDSCSAPATVTITVTPVNDAPVAVTDTYSVEEDEELTVSAPGVLSNDTDVEGDALSVATPRPVSGPSNGTLILNEDGSFIYTPDEDFNGTDTFTYRATDGTDESNEATVTITVTPANDAPVAVPDSYSVEEDEELTVDAPGVLGNDTDIEGDDLTAELETGPSNGTLTLNEDGSFTYTPDEDFEGTDSFTYKACDSPDSCSVPTTVTITVTAVNDAPVAVADTYTTNEDEELTVAAPGVLSNDTDLEGDTLTVATPRPVSDPSNGMLTLNSDGSFTYTPNAGFSGEDSFTYRATDGTDESNTATVTITVTSANDAPVAVADSYSVEEDEELTVPAPGVLSNDTDLEGDALTAELVTGPSSGTLTLNEDGSFTYTPDADFSGTDSFTYRACDGPDSCSAPTTVTITVTPVNDAPVAVADSYTTNEDEELMVAAPGVLGNDTDLEGDELSVATPRPVSGPSNGNLTLNEDGSFTYTPNAGFSGEDSFTYRATDDTDESNEATVTITVTPANDDPVANDQVVTAEEDTPETITLTGSDANGDELTFEITEGPDDGTLSSISVVNCTGTAPKTCQANVTYTPDTGFSGTDSFRFHVDDGTNESNEATVTITVTPVNDAPVAVNDTYTTDEDETLTIPAPGVLGNDTDAEGDTLEAVLVNGPTSGTLTLSSNGSFTYAPNNNFFGTDTFTYGATDGTTESNTATVTINVTPAHDVPVANDDAATTNEDESVDIDVLANDTDPDGDTLEVESFTQPDNGEVRRGSNGTLRYTPDENFSGTETFEYTVSDGNGGTDTATVTITVAPVNDAPVAVDDAYSTNEDETLNVGAPGVLSNDTDVENDRLTAELVRGPENGTLDLNADGSFTNEPDTNFDGADTFTYKACEEGGACSNEATVRIIVTPDNDAPRANPDQASTDEISPVTVDVLANDTDPDGKADIDPSTVSVVTGPANGETSVNPQTDKITYTPNQGFVGTDTFTYKVCDESGACSNEATVTITVEPAACTIRGTNGNDNLRGTNGPDVICGFGGNDTIDGRGGDDIIRGGDGRDTMKGGTGIDRLFGEDGNDFLNMLDRVRGNDQADGGPDNDDCAADRRDKRVSCP